MRKGKFFYGDVHIYKFDHGNYFIRQNDLEYFSNHIRTIEYMEEEKDENKLKRYVKELFQFIYLATLKSSHESSVFNILVPFNYPIYAAFLTELYRHYPTSSIHIIFLEEGIGAYIRNPSRWEERGTEKMEGIQKKFSVMKNHFVYKIWQRPLLLLLRNKQMLRYFHIFDKDNGNLIPNAEVCSAFAEAFRKQPLRNKISSSLYQDAVVVNSQPFFEELNSTIDIQCYQQISIICNKLNIPFFLKPHPREKNLDRYRNNRIKLDVQNADVSQECIFANSESKPKVIVGFFSTTLITSHLFWGIPAISLGKIEDCQSLNGYSTDLHRFMEIFSKQLIIPKSYIELERILSSLP
jgi:hypothetical protein